MDKKDCIEIIKRYELARQVVSILIKKRKELIDTCSKIDPVSLSGEICLVTAYKEWQDICNINGEMYPYDEVLEEGDYCQNCKDAFSIKHNELAAAKDEFGKAKRALSSFGKKLIKGV